MGKSFEASERIPCCGDGRPQKQSARVEIDSLSCCGLAGLLIAVFVRMHLLQPLLARIRELILVLPEACHDSPSARLHVGA